MKKYQNVGNEMICVVFETHSQFLFRGQSITTDDTPVRLPKRGLAVTDMNPKPVKEETASVEAVEKKKASPKVKKKKLN